MLRMERSVPAAAGRSWFTRSLLFILEAFAAIRTSDLSLGLNFYSETSYKNDIITFMFKVIVSLITAISFCLLLILLNVTTPVKAGPFGVLSVLALLYASSLGCVAFFLFAISSLLSKFSTIIVMRRPIQPLSFRRSYHFSTILGVVPVILVGLQSVGSIGFYEVLLVFIFVIIGVIYISKKTQ